MVGWFTAGLLLLAIGTADAGERRRAASPQHQTRGMIERLHDRGGHRGRQDSHDGSRRQQHDRERHHGHHNVDRRRHDHRDRHHLRGGHSRHGGGYWYDYHHHRASHHHGYRYRFHNNYHYYYNAAGFYFPGFGLLAHGHVHDRHCPHWHFEDFAAGFVLGAIIVD
jgi:hypothetical protein